MIWEEIIRIDISLYLLPSLLIAQPQQMHLWRGVGGTAEAQPKTEEREWRSGVQRRRS